MTPLPLEPATLAFDEAGAAYSPRYADIYHPRAGAFEQARHVFLAGNQLPARWQGRSRFVILETGFGLGNNFLATWAAWRDDPKRSEHLVFISIEAHPLHRVDLVRAHASSPAPLLRDALIEAWPPLTPDLHRLEFDAAKVQLLLALGDVQRWLPQLVASVDAFFLDGFAPARNPRMWDERVCKGLGRLAAPEATLATWTAAKAVRSHLTTAGFEVRLAPGSGGKRDITLARYAPVFMPRRSLSPAAAPSPVSHALIVGGGLAGCAAAWALAEQGWHSTIIERHAGLACEASGNPAGLFHGIVNAQDGLHAQFNRAAALMATEVIRASLRQHGVFGAVTGLLRLETSLTHPDMVAMIAALGLPPDYVQAVDAGRASELAGIPLQAAAWHYPGGGWVDPAGLARAYVLAAGERVTLLSNATVQSLQPIETDGVPVWRLVDAGGVTIAETPTVVLANAGDALRLLDSPAWPVERIRGQISVWPEARRARHSEDSSCRASTANTANTAFALPRIPIAGAGYLLPPVAGTAIFGATATRDDADPAIRRADHVANLARLERLIGQPSAIDPDELEGRVGWRWSSRDRLPVIGAVPRPGISMGMGMGIGIGIGIGGVDQAGGSMRRLEQPRFVPRIPGLFVFTALGSRGITWSALGARVLAAKIAGAPVPLASALLDAVDPARFFSRDMRREVRRDLHPERSQDLRRRKAG